MSRKFKNGMVVYLKSGSPKMTINTYNSITNRYTCCWFDNAELKCGDFSEDALTDTITEP